MQEIQREIHMAVYTESYRDLCHGTDTCSAEKIRKDGFLSSTAKSNWCGDGTYFYDIKAKAWWAAHRKCRQIQKDTGIKLKAEVIFADIININKKDIYPYNAFIIRIFPFDKSPDNVQKECQKQLKIRIFSLTELFFKRK